MTELPQCCVDVWIFELRWVRAALLAGTCGDVLNALDAAAALRFRHAPDRGDCRLRHGLRRLVLARTLGARAEALLFVTEANGRPQLSGPGHAWFSDSHTDGWYGIAVSRDGQPGFDIEALRLLPDVNALCVPACTMEEREMLLAIRRAARSTAFLRLWTRKESILKAAGVGLLAAPSSVDLSAWPFDVPCRHGTMVWNGVDVAFRDVESLGACVAAVACWGTVATPTVNLRMNVDPTAPAPDGSD